jgi:predicted nucleic acid-binding protein
MTEAWAVYDAVLEDERVALYSEPAGLDAIFRSLSLSGAASPKLWADAYLVAFASGHQGHVVTFDRGMRDRGTDCIILHQPL